MSGRETYVVSCNEDESEWYIVQRITTGDKLRRVPLPKRYPSESDATEAMIQLIESAR